MLEVVVPKICTLRSSSGQPRLPACRLWECAIAWMPNNASRQAKHEACNFCSSVNSAACPAGLKAPPSPSRTENNDVTLAAHLTPATMNYQSDVTASPGSPETQAKLETIGMQWIRRASRSTTCCRQPDDTVLQQPRFCVSTTGAPGWKLC